MVNGFSTLDVDKIEFETLLACEQGRDKISIKIKRYKTVKFYDLQCVKK